MRRQDVDMLKGLAIIAVVIYHMGYLSSGYLGVDVFLVISGYLSIPSISKKVAGGVAWGGYFRFIANRVIRLVPLVIIACVVCLLIGAYAMLPDDYENLSESVVASLLFSNNILAYITTGNYWDVVNDYKPLMHTWYLGIIFEFYIFFPLFLLLVGRWKNKGTKCCTWLLTVISFLLYIIPVASDASKFYLIPFRFFEFGIGGLIALYSGRGIKDKGTYKKIGFLTIILLLLTLCWGFIPYRISSTLLLLTTVSLTGISLIYNEKIEVPTCITTIGKMSLSIYIWHQIILAFFRYYLGKNNGIGEYLIMLLILIILSTVTYLFVEKKITLNKRSIVITIIIWAIAFIAPIKIYLQAGVIRDVPELSIIKGETHRGMFAEYSDRIYGYDKDFTGHDKINVFIVGNSFARDWANVLLESEYADSIHISYVHNTNPDYIKKVNKRVKDADIIFIHTERKNAPDAILRAMKTKPVWAIGTKNFGESNGMIYSQRHRQNYLRTIVDCSPEILEQNVQWKQGWGEHYIDMIEPVWVSDGKVRVFTDEGLFISMDTRHLTQAGAQYYAKHLNINKYFKNKK